MHSHLAIEGKNGTVALKPDASLTITDKNPMFNDLEMHSYPFELPFDLNRHLMKNIDDVNSTLRAQDVEGEQFRIIADGLPLRNTVMKVQDDVVMKDALSVNLDASHKTFKDMIQDMRCRDVTVDDDILIGEKIGDIQIDLSYQEKVIIFILSGFKGWFDGYQVNMNPVHLTEMFQPPALGYSYPAECYEDPTTHEAEPATDSQKATKTYPNPNKEEDLKGSSITVKVPRVKTSYINVSKPYPQAKYCNTRIAYAHHKVEMEDNAPTGETSDEIVPASERQRDIQEDKSPYWVLPADRPASGICFYVAYFLERLFKTLGVAYDMSALTSIEDFNYLAFVSTQCHYDTAVKDNISFSSEELINKWLESRGCGGQLHLNDNVPENAEQKEHMFIPKGDYVSWERIGDHASPYGNIESSDGIHIDSGAYIPGTDGDESMISGHSEYDVSYIMTTKVLQMFANSDNFPDANVSEVIESLENSFGVRFCYDQETNKVTVKLLRDMFRDTTAPIKFKGIVTDMHKKTEHIKGVKMKYSAEDDIQTQQDNVRYGKRDYDTTYNYIDYPERYTKFASFDEVTKNIDVGNRNGYCDLQTGDFFRIKVSSDASTTAELRPAVFEVGQMNGVNLGDCSKEAEDEGAIKEFVSSFEPVMVNDVSYRGKNYGEQEDPLLVPFIDEDMEHEFLLKKMLNPISTKWGSVDIVYEMCMAECYDPTSTDDGQSPLQHHDWGLTVGFLRIGNLGESVVEYERGYDGFDNSKWLVTSKNYALTADTFDEHGNFLGTSPAGSFSLKPRAWKPFLYYIDRGGNVHITTDLSLVGQRVYHNQDPQYDYVWMIPCNEDERNAQGIITARRRSRGMCDTWMIEFFHFLLERQRYEVKALCTAAELADIPNNWTRRYSIDGHVGYINKYSYSISDEQGIGKVTIDFYAI